MIGIGRKNGWQVMWLLLTTLGIFSPFGSSPGSVEGMIYTTIPLGSQLTGLIEILAQSLLLSIVLWYWVDHPEKKWLTWVLEPLFFLVLLLSALGAIALQAKS